MMRTLFAFLLLALNANAQASDLYVIACGEGRESGFESAELALVDDPEAMPKFYRDGEALADELFAVTARDGGWIVTVHGSAGKPDVKYEFSVNKKNVQKFLIGEKSDKKTGAAKSCKFGA
jgi:SHS2 domain-containing protein